MNQATTPAALDLDKLLPCPFCGGACQVTKGFTTNGDWPYGDFYRIFCGKCQARQLFHRTASDAIAAWNRRSPSAAGSEQDPRTFTVHQAGALLTNEPVYLASQVDAAIAQRAASAPAAPIYQAEFQSGSWTDIDAKDIPNWTSAMIKVRTLYAEQPTQQAAPEAPASAQPAEFGGMPGGYVVKRVEGHGWVIDPPKGSRWVAFEGTPAGDLLANLASAQPVAAAPAGWLDHEGRMIDALREFIEGMSVSMDVSTGDYDAGHRYFGIINEVMDDDGDKYGVTLLVYDAQPNFAAPAAPVAQATTASASNIKTWRERLPKGAGLSYDYAHVCAMKAEIDELRTAFAQQGAPQRCEHCDGTGDVHRADGEWAGTCTCPAGASQGQAGEGDAAPEADGWIAVALVNGEHTSVAFRDEETARAMCVEDEPLPFLLLSQGEK